MRALRALLLSGAIAWAGAAIAYDAEALVSASPGDLPVILTAPHDGGETVGALPARTKGTTLRDAGTAKLAEATAAAIERATGKRPYVVIARFSRKSVDANRPEDEAFESDAARPAWRAYHDRISSYIAEMRKRFPKGALLIDIHGQGQEPRTIFRGTRHGLTTRALLRRAGNDALQGPKSLTGQLAAHGYGVNPPVDAQTLEEDPRFNGGFTVFAYGSQRAEGVDAIQLEFGKAYRDDPRLPRALADSILGFTREYGFGP